MTKWADTDQRIRTVLSSEGPFSNLLDRRALTSYSTNGRIQNIQGHCTSLFVVVTPLRTSRVEAEPGTCSRRPRLVNSCTGFETPLWCYCILFLWMVHLHLCRRGIHEIVYSTTMMMILYLCTFIAILRVLRVGVLIFKF